MGSDVVSGESILLFTLNPESTSSQFQLMLSAKYLNSIKHEPNLGQGRVVMLYKGTLAPSAVLDNTRTV